MKKIIFTIFMFLWMILPAIAAMDPVAESAATVDFWTKPDLFVNHFSKSGGVTILSGAGMSAYSDFYTDLLSKENGDIFINFVGRGQENKYSWKTAVWNTAFLQRRMTNDDYKRMLILVADHLADNDKRAYGADSMPPEYFLMFVVNALGRNMQSGGTPLIHYLSMVMKNPQMKQLNPTSGYGKFWSAIVTGNNTAALNALKSVPSERLSMPITWHELQVFNSTDRH